MPSRSNYAFISNIRFWSMAAVVGIHSLFLWDDHSRGLSATGILQIALTQCAKFGTICFFLISGFLLGDRLPQSEPWSYFRRRWRSIGNPWLVWSAAFYLMGLVHYDSHGGITPEKMRSRLVATLFYSIYWFIPNSLFSLAFLLAFRKYLNELWFGAALATFSLFFAINTYLRWIPNEHTTAMGGYIFYLWLGYWACTHLNKVERFTKAMSFGVLWAALILCALCAMGETLVLIALGSGASATTLRFSNQVFSILVGVLLVKCRPVWPRFVSIREETFGIYLLHPFTMLFAESGIEKVHAYLFGHVLMGDIRVWSHPAYALCYWVLGYLVTYGVALIGTKALIALQLGSLVGYKTEKRKETAPFPAQVIEIQLPKAA